ncbi:unnamed protein product [Protopolystoma xenopodis]|uniref:Uncharacterized protein n=1 Tax=Protopolystoma xenopodis TaxID=117903 RepID=A0A448XSQ3_9PLAT|nr:unnamed protein product [Protopolystoma xenopodis]
MGMQQFKPTEFATQISLNMDNALGILRCVIDFFMKQEDGKYLLLKDPNKVGVLKSKITYHDAPSKANGQQSLHLN